MAEPPTKKKKQIQTKLNFSTFSSQSEPKSSGQLAEEPKSSSSSAPTDRTIAVCNEPSLADFHCAEDCCRDIEAGKAAQLIIDKKETARLFGQRERYFNAEWYKSRVWLVLCKTTKRAFCEICRFAAVKQLVTFSKCGEDSFVKSGTNNWKKCPSLFDNHEKSHFHKECLQKKNGILKSGAHKCSTCKKPVH